MTRTVAETFTFTHAKRLASKVAADMKRCQSIYGWPSDGEINNYCTELAILLRDGYVAEYEFGYQKDGERHVTWHYKVDTSGNLTTDDRPGKIAEVSIVGCERFNFLTYSSAWQRLSQAQKDAIKTGLPISRSDGTGPKDGRGYWTSDLNYYSGGVSMPRRTFQPY